VSTVLQERAIDLLWRQWTALGVAGVAKTPNQAIDLEALIAFTPFVSAEDPRLGDEALDWCTRIGKRFVSISRLRRVARAMPERATTSASDLVSVLVERATPPQRLSKKSRSPTLEPGCLLQLKSRSIFGIGARADVLARFAMRGKEPVGVTSINPGGYSKQAIANALDELANAGVLKKVLQTSASYSLIKEKPLRALLAPLPPGFPSWMLRFAIVAEILETWRRLRTRKTYAIELAKALDRIRPVISAAGEHAPLTGRPNEVVAQIERWALTLLDDDVWEYGWTFGVDDVTHKILTSIHEEVVEAVHAENPVGSTVLDDLRFRSIDRKVGTAEFFVDFNSEHPADANISFSGHVEGALSFDPQADTMKEFLASLKVSAADAHFSTD
jgi:hypothetical protein